MAFSTCSASRRSAGRFARRTTQRLRAACRTSRTRGESSRRRESSSTATFSTRASATWPSSRIPTGTRSCCIGGTRLVIEVHGIDYIRIPVQDIEPAKEFYGEVLGLPDGPSQHEDWVEYQAGNVTLAVMTPETHDEEFVPLAPGSVALGVPDVAAAKAALEAEGVQVNDIW